MYVFSYIVNNYTYQFLIILLTGTRMVGRIFCLVMVTETSTETITRKDLTKLNNLNT